MRERVRPLCVLIAALLTVAVPAASAPQAGVAAGDPEVRLLALLRARVKYVFVIYQENRSFDSYFGTYPGADGLYSKPAAQTPGFEQTILNLDGSSATIVPFRIGPAEFAADTDDVDHSHSRIDAKMDVTDGVARMDRFALTEEKKYSPSGNPTLVAKQFGELTMAHEDCDTVPFLWRYAKNFVLFDQVFQSMTGPSTPGNLSIIAAQTGITQLLLHPEQKGPGNGDAGAGVPVLDDADPFWGSPSDRSAHPMPVNPRDFPGYETQRNLTFASLALTMEGHRLRAEAKRDADPAGDLNDVRSDIEEISLNGRTVPWGWYEEGYDREPTDDGAGPLDAQGSHASYVTHHNGPQYFGYVANNPALRAHLHGLDDLLGALDEATLPRAGGVYYVKGGYKNIFGLQPADANEKVRKNFMGDDDHPGYSDAQISEAMVAQVVDRIARSTYWSQSAIVLTWDDSEGDYDHVPPPVRGFVPGEGAIAEGPRVPLLVISPYAKTGAIDDEAGDQGSVVKLVDELFGLQPLAELPDEIRASGLGARAGLGPEGLGPDDGLTSGTTNLLSAFDVARLAGKRPPLAASRAIVPESIVRVLPQRSGYGCRSLGIVPTDVALGIPNPIPSNFNPRPKTNPSKTAGSVGGFRRYAGPVAR